MPGRARRRRSATGRSRRARAARPRQLQGGQRPARARRRRRAARAGSSRGLRRAVRPMDTVGRLGGDEFAVLAPGARRTRRASELGERIRAACCRSGSRSRPGIACFPVDGLDPDELQRHADRQLYEQKHGLAAELRRRPPRAELGGDARARRRRAHGEPRRALGDRRPLRGRHRAAARLGRRRPRLPAHRRDAPRRRQGRRCPTTSSRSPDRSTSASTRRSRRHPVIGAEFVNRVDGLSLIAVWVKHSHEHFDGSGYPDGLAGERDPARLAHPAGRRRVRRDDERPPVPRRGPARGSARRAAPQRRPPVRPALRRRVRGVPGRREPPSSSAAEQLARRRYSRSSDRVAPWQCVP